MDSFLILSEKILIAGGVVACLLSICLGFRFYKLKVPFGRALGFMCYADAIASFVILIFAMTSYLKLYYQLNPWTVLWLRTIMFSVLIASSLHLYLTMQKVIKNATE